MGRPVAMPLEIVPLTDPTTLKRGEKATFQLLEAGEPLSNAALGLLSEQGARTFQTTDADGHATFAIDEAGRALFFAVSPASPTKSNSESNWR